MLLLAAAITSLVASPVTGADARQVNVVVLGDSLSAGPGLVSGQAFPEVLQRRLRAAGRDVAITNAGVSGDTAADGLARMDWSIPDGTDLVIVELGANDMLRGYDNSATRATLDTIFRRIKDRGIGLVIAGMHSIDNYGPRYRQQFEAIYPELAKTYGAPLYPFFMVGIYERPELVLFDHMHPNAAGVEAMVGGFLPFIQPIVDTYARGAPKSG